MKGSSAVDLNKRYTYADYITWPENERWELINGVPYDMSPAPRLLHQDIQACLTSIIYNFLKGKPCKVYGAPVDVVLNTPSEHPEDEDLDTVVQPDLVVVCSMDKLRDEKRCIGAPDLVVEILSPSTGYKDETAKLKLYEQNGVREYWIVNPDARYMMIYRLEDSGRYAKPDYLREEDTLTSGVLAGFSVPLSEIWADITPG